MHLHQLLGFLRPPLSRRTPASAPATELGLDFAETFNISIPSSSLFGPPLCSHSEQLGYIIPLLLYSVNNSLIPACQKNDVISHASIVLWTKKAYYPFKGL